MGEVYRARDGERILAMVRAADEPNTTPHGRRELESAGIFALNCRQSRS
jgi:hypothetical protein